MKGGKVKLETLYIVHNVHNTSSACDGVCYSTNIELKKMHIPRRLMSLLSF
jgi:hypothetical protein